MSTRLLAATALLVSGVLLATDPSPFWRMAGAVMLVFVPALVSEHVRHALVNPHRYTEHDDVPPDLPAFERLLAGIGYGDDEPDDGPLARDPLAPRPARHRLLTLTDAMPAGVAGSVLYDPALHGPVPSLRGASGPDPELDDAVWRRRRGY